MNIITTDINKKISVEMPIDRISEKNINPRITLNQENVQKLADAGEFPPIFLGVVEKEIIVIDGYHRLEATKLLGKPVVPCFVMEFASMEEAENAAFKANLNHGLRLDDAEIARGVVKHYHRSLKLNPEAVLTETLKMFEIQFRGGRVLYYWSFINHHVLENNTDDLRGRSFFESFASLFENIDVTEVPKEFKDKFKEFYNKYAHLGRAELREAIKMFKEGKDYDEEIAKTKEAEKPVVDATTVKEEVSKTSEIIDEETGEIIAGGDVEETNDEEPTTKEKDYSAPVEKSTEKQVAEKIEPVKTTTGEITCSGLLGKGSQEIMEFMYMVEHGHCSITNEDKAALIVLRDSLNVFIASNENDDKNATLFGDV